MDRMTIAIALEEGMIVESDDGTRYISEENMCGGKYAMNYVENGFWMGMNLTNSLEEAIAFVS
jgi:hypothetical protein